MKKVLALFIILLLLSIGSFGYFFAEINKEKDNVTVTEKTVFGDKSYAENIKVNFESTYNNLLFWKTSHTIGAENSTKTDFIFSKKHLYEIEQIEDYLDLSSDMRLSTMMFFDDPDYADEGINRAFKELAEEAEPYEETEKTILLSDYYEYYPLEINCSFGNAGHSFSFFDNDENTKQVTEKFESFFRIPVLPDEAMKISVITSGQGQISNGFSSTVYNGHDSFSFSTTSAVTEKACYLAFDNRTYNDELVDTSLIPGGYGIYRIPYSIKDRVPVFDFDKLKMVFSLDENNSAYSLSLNKEKTKLHLLTKEGTKVFLTVIDTNTHKELQKIELVDSKFERVYIDYTDKDFILYSFYKEIGVDGENYIILVTVDENGNYDKYFTVPSNDVFYHSQYSDAKFKDGKLYITDTVSKKYVYTDPDGNRMELFSTCSGFSLGIYDKTGMLFHGEYSTSLEAGADYNRSNIGPTNGQKTIIELP